MVDKSPQVSSHMAAMLASMRRQVTLTPALEAAFQAVPRHHFLPDLDVEQAYQDNAIPLKTNQSGMVISSGSQPTMMAIMLEQLDLKRGDNVLEIGTASGYNAAIIQHIVGDNGHVTSIELESDLAQQAVRNLGTAGVSGVHVVVGDGANGYAPRAAYDHIIATVGVWDIPTAWLNQLKPRGRLVVPVLIDGVQVSSTFTEQPDGTYLSTDNRPCAFVYLRGESEGPSQRLQIGSTSLYLLGDEINRLDRASVSQLLSESYDRSSFDAHLSTSDYWYGFQLYLMIEEPRGFIFSLYHVQEGQQAFGLDGRGIALFGPASAAFAPYKENGSVYSFGGADAYLAMHEIYDNWAANQFPRGDQLRVRLVPKSMGKPDITFGRLYERRTSYLHVWIESMETTT